MQFQPWTYLIYWQAYKGNKLLSLIFKASYPNIFISKYLTYHLLGSWGIFKKSKKKCKKRIKEKTKHDNLPCFWYSLNDLLKDTQRIWISLKYTRLHVIVAFFTLSYKACNPMRSMTSQRNFINLRKKKPIWIFEE